MYWIVQENLYNEAGFDSLIQALTRLELPYSIHKIVPFVGDIEPNCHPQGKVIVMGSYSMTKLAQIRKWYPGSFINSNFDFVVQRKHWGDYMLNADASVYQFENIPQHNKPFFLRPVHDTKSFPAKVYDWDEFDVWRESVLSLSRDDNPTVYYDTECVLAKPKDIYAEYRTWIIDGRVITASKYKTGTWVNYDEIVPDDVKQFAEQMCAIWTPHRAFVLDICESEFGLKILEVNNLNSAGFYKGNVQKLVEGLEIAFN